MSWVTQDSRLPPTSQPEAKIAQKEIVELIENAKSNIDIVMYNIDYKKFEKALRKVRVFTIDEITINEIDEAIKTWAKN